MTAESATDWELDLATSLTLGRQFLRETVSRIASPSAVVSSSRLLFRLDTDLTLVLEASLRQDTEAGHGQEPTEARVLAGPSAAPSTADTTAYTFPSPAATELAASGVGNPGTAS